MDCAKQRQNAKAFITQWKGKEDEETQKFWISLLQDVLGIPQAVRLLDFEKKVKINGENKSIDAYIKPTKILIEQKSSDKSLTKAYRQSDGDILTPYEQALRYRSHLGKDLDPNYIVTCNFREFHIHNMKDPSADPVVIKLEDLPTQVHRLAFLVDVEKEITAFEQKISIKAGEIVGEIYEALLAQYADKNNPESLKSLNKLCVRLVFCLYAEDSGLFSTRLEFHDYLKKYSANARTALIQLFKVLNTPEDKRDQYLEKDLLAFPYVNGGLFADEDIEIPRITPEIVELILKKASEGFDWSLISPTIFGAVFESTLNPETRRKGGMHYTSVENIHKVIDPLFLDELKDDLKKSLELKVPGTRKKRLEAFRKKLGSLTFLDPACGSGNFLTETYKCLRKLENEALREIYQGQMALGEDLSPIEVHIKQFYGIEINDFAVTVARTALWIAESQMMRETEDIVGQDLDFLPLKSSAFIHEGNALRMDWNDLIPISSLNYIMGNPPFVGYSNQTPAQKEDILNLYVDEDGKPYKISGKNDYVSGWFFKASSFVTGSTVHCAFVATNSITQGEQVTNVWRPIFSRFGIHIDFAYTTFKWTSDSLDSAAVHVVVIGFSYEPNNKKKRIFTGTEEQLGNEINPYLRFGETVFLESRKTPISPEAPAMKTGNRPADGGNLILSPQEYKIFIKNNPAQAKWIKKLSGSEEFLNNSYRYCLWLVGATPKDISSCKYISDRVNACREDRLNGADDRKKLAKTPHLFRETNNPNSYLIIPCASSENSLYLPIGFLNGDVIATNLATIVEDATPYDFGVLSSSVHMAWMRAVAGRLKSDYRYSKDIVYNNFPWPKPTKIQKENIQKTAKKILLARQKYPETSLADMYRQEMYLYSDLVKAHEENDKAVLDAYGFNSSMSEAEIVDQLFDLYKARLKEEKKRNKATKKK